jgi:hypothetical protein
MNQKDQIATFERGSTLSIFGSDRLEDLVALVLAFILAMVIYFIY